ncbi:MAG: hypothetical protein R2792_13110 [Saprospiraceae bacterium]
MNNLIRIAILSLVLALQPNWILGQVQSYELSSGTLPALDSLPARYQLVILQDQCTKALMMRNEWKGRHAEALVQIDESAANYNEAKADTNSTKEQLKVLRQTLRSAQKEGRTALRYYDRIDDAYKKGLQTLEQDSVAIVQLIPAFHKDLLDFQAATYPEEVVPDADTVVEVTETPSTVVEDTQVLEEEATETPANPQQVAKSASDYLRYNTATDVMRTPPQPPCRFAIERTDEFTGRKYSELEKSELFRFTSPVMKQLLGKDPHILCESTLAKNGDELFLNLYFSIRDPRAKRSFGSLPKDALIAILLVDGTTINLYNKTADDGTGNDSDSVFRYRAQLTLDKTAFRKLQTTEVDKMRVSWSTGFEDYNIYRVGILMNQCNCMD